MAILRIITSEQYTLDGMLKYIIDSEKHIHGIVYYNAIGVDPFFCSRDMLLCKLLYQQLKGVQYKQIILAFTEVETLTIDADYFIKPVIEVAQLIHELTNCQIAYAIHNNTDNIHVHFVVNTVRISDGKKVQINNEVTRILKEKINYIFKKYDLDMIKSIN